MWYVNAGGLLYYVPNLGGSKVGGLAVCENRRLLPASRHAVGPPAHAYRVCHVLQVNVPVSGAKFSDPACGHVHLLGDRSRAGAIPAFPEDVPHLGLVQLGHCANLLFAYIATLRTVPGPPPGVSSAADAQAVTQSNTPHIQYCPTRRGAELFSGVQSRVTET